MSKKDNIVKMYQLLQQSKSPTIQSEQITVNSFKFYKKIG